MKNNHLILPFILVLLAFFCFAKGLKAQDNSCNVQFAPQLQIGTNSIQTEQLESIVYAVDGDFYQLEMPFQQISKSQPLIIDLPAIQLKSGIHILSYYVKTKAGSEVEVTPVIGVKSQETPMLNEDNLLKSQATQMQTCACEQLLDGQEPDASNWFRFYENAEGDFALFTSEDKGKSWTRPAIADRTDDGCPEFAFAELSKASEKNGIEVLDVPLPFLDMVAYPSPFINELNLRLQVEELQDMVIRLIDTQGRVIEELVHKDAVGTIEHQFKTGGLAKGPYYISVKTEQGNYSRVVVRF